MIALPNVANDTDPTGYNEDTSIRSALGAEHDEGRNAEPAYPMVRLPSSRIGIFAVVDENGYIVPIVTATDLLLDLKARWKATFI